MTRLIVLNGPPAAGKSTMARMYVADHPLALALDVDLVRAQLGAWRTDPQAAGLAARRLAVVMAREHLRAGHDVVVPQLVARPGFLDQLAALAAETGARYDELVLLDAREAMLARFAARSGATGEQPHPDAQQLVDTRGGVAHLESLYDDLVAMIATRPGAKVVRVHDGDPERTYAELVARLG